MSTLKETQPKDTNNIIEKNNENFQHRLPQTPLETLGFDEWFESNGKDYLNDNFSLARIVEVHKNNYKVSNGRHDIIGELTGKFLFNIKDSTEYPTVGDWAVVQYFDDESFAIIHHILPRKSLLKRKDPGKAISFQLIASNIDYAFIVQSVDANFNLNRLERYFVMVNDGNIQPIVVLSKTDLITEAELSEITERIKRFNDKYLVLPISSLTDSGMETLKEALEPCKTYCLLGSSGVGKTTLLNKLIGEKRFDVTDVRIKDSKGRHTTTRRQLTVLTRGSIIIDTPGMRELGAFSVDTGLDETFDEIISHGSRCRFKDCTHTHEEGCAVKEALLQGEIDEDRYQNFQKIQKESAFYEMSYSEKRRKDKAFSKMVKRHKISARKK